MSVFTLQGEQATKGHEVISLKSEIRDLRLELDQKNKEINILRIGGESRKLQKAEVDKLNIQIEELTAKLEMVSFRPTYFNISYN